MGALEIDIIESALWDAKCYLWGKRQTGDIGEIISAEIVVGAWERKLREARANVDR